MAADFEVNEASLDYILSRGDENHARLVGLDGMTPSEAEEVQADSVAQYLISIMFQSITFDAQDGTLDAAMSSGRLQVLEDAGLRNLLVSWKQGVLDIPEEAGPLRQGDDRILDRVTELGGPWLVEEFTGPSLQSLAFQRRMSMFPRGGLEAIVGDEELKQLLRGKRFRSNFYLFGLERLSSLADSITARIDANLR